MDFAFTPVSFDNSPIVIKLCLFFIFSLDLPIMVYLIILFIVSHIKISVNLILTLTDVQLKKKWRNDNE